MTARQSPWLRYVAAAGLAMAAQLARLPLHPATVIPYITYVPFIVLGAVLGWGAGLLATGLCVAEALFFAVEPVGSFAIRDPHDWIGLLLLALTGLVATAAFARMRRSGSALQIAIERVEADRSLLDAVFSAQTDAMLVVNAQGEIIRTNPAAKTHFGFEAAGTGIEEFFQKFPVAGGLNASFTRRALRGEITTRGEQRAGDRILETSSAPMIGPNGIIRGAITISRDITDRKNSEEAVRAAHAELCAQEIKELKGAQRELRRQAELINLSHDAIVTADANRTILGWNRGAEEMYGWKEAEALNKRLPELLETVYLIPVDDVERTLGRERRWEGEIRHRRRDGSQRLLDSRQVLLRDATGAASAILEINRDITERRRAEDALRDTVRDLQSALAEKTVLLKEVHHRVKNNLAIISSLLSLKAEATGSEEARVALGESQQRVHSMALIHELLYGSERLDRINFPDYAQQLISGLSGAFTDDARRVSIEMQLDPIELEIERAVPCALILNELLSNAFKHAFRGHDKANILVSFRQNEPGWLTLAVEDNGVGLPNGCLETEDRKSLGLRIVRILSKQLDGSLRQEPCNGTRLVLRFPAKPAFAKPADAAA